MTLDEMLALQPGDIITRDAMKAPFFSLDHKVYSYLVLSCPKLLSLNGTYLCEIVCFDFSILAPRSSKIWPENYELLTSAASIGLKKSNP